MTTLEDLAGLEGLTPVETCELLYTLAGDVPAGESIVEIGTYMGKTACYLAAGAQAGNGAHVWTVDPHDLPGYRTTTGRQPGTIDFTRTEIRETAERQIREAGHADHVTMIHDFSVEAAKSWTGPPVGLLFIDGDHRQHAARLDFRTWQPHLSWDAVIAWDDYAPSHPGVPAAARGMVEKGVITEPTMYGRVAITQLVPPALRKMRDRQ